MAYAVHINGNQIKSTTCIYSYRPSQMEMLTVDLYVTKMYKHKRFKKKGTIDQTINQKTKTIIIVSLF